MKKDVKSNATISMVPEDICMIANITDGVLKNSRLFEI
jgi:hypothetical protein